MESHARHYSRYSRAFLVGIGHSTLQWERTPDGNQGEGCGADDGRPCREDHPT